MYDWLVAKLGPPAANVVYGLWYAAIMLVVVIFGSTPETTLRYLHL